MPKRRNQRCPFHKSSPVGTSLSFYQHEKSGQWMFCCNSAECGIKGDVIDSWFELLKRAGLYRADWSRLRAAGDLLERVNSGEIDPSIREFEDVSASRPHGHARRYRGGVYGKGVYWSQLQELIKKCKGQGIAGRRKLPRPIKLKVQQVICGLFPENRLIMLAERRGGWHHIRRRDDWLAGRYYGKPALQDCGFVSQNYCSRKDVDGTSYPAFAGIERRWLVIEGDHGSLEEQFWIHKQLGPRRVCWSGGKSLHGWYDVSGWTAEECFQLFAEAIRLGVTDPRNWLICRQARLPGGWNSETKQKQAVLTWYSGRRSFEAELLVIGRFRRKMGKLLPLVLFSAFRCKDRTWLDLRPISPAAGVDICELSSHYGRQPDVLP